MWRLAVTYSRTGTPALPSAMHRFTAEFGMGSGGSNALLPPGKLAKMGSEESARVVTLALYSDPIFSIGVLSIACVLQSEFFWQSHFCVSGARTRNQSGSVHQYMTGLVECSGAAHAEMTKPKRVLVLYDQATRAISTG